MSSELRSRDLDWLASAIEQYFIDQGFTVSRDAVLFEGAPRIAFRMRKGAEDVLVELRQKADLPTFLQTFVMAAIAREEPATLCVAIAEEEDEEEREQAAVPFDALRRIRGLGVGLLRCGSNGTEVIERAVPFSLRVVIPPRLRADPEVQQLAAKFNRGDSLDGLRDLVVYVEGLVQDVARRGVQFGVLNCDEQQLNEMDLNGIIDMLATPNFRGQPQLRLLTAQQRADLHSFRTARNLVQHAPRNRAVRQTRDRQLKERMTLGFRLVEEVRRVRVPRQRPAAPPP